MSGGGLASRMGKLWTWTGHGRSYKMQVKSCQRWWTGRTGTRGSSPRNYKQDRVTSPRAKRGRGPWIISGQAVWRWQNQSGRTVRHKAQSMVVIHGWKDGRTNGQSGRRLVSNRHLGRKPIRSVVARCSRMECQWTNHSLQISSFSFE